MGQMKDRAAAQILQAIPPDTPTGQALVEASELGPVQRLLTKIFGLDTIQPGVPPAPQPYPVVTPHGPTVDLLINRLPLDLRQRYIENRLRANPAWAGSAVRGAAPVGDDLIALNPDVIADPDPDMLYRTLAHEAQHKVQQASPNFKGMTNKEQEEDAYRRAQLELNAIIGQRQVRNRE